MTEPAPPAPPAPPARRHRDDGLATKLRIEAAALRLFRDRGFDRTTMRDVARRARVSLGLAYHYFPSKESFVLAYYAGVQREHALVATRELDAARTLADRIRVGLETKQRLVGPDRDLLAALTRVLIDPRSPLSAFSAETRAIRDEAVAVFRTVVEHPDVPEDLRDTAATLLWAAHMGVLLRFVFDESEGQRDTAALVEAITELAPAFLAAAASPVLEPVRRAVVARLEGLGLVLHAPPRAGGAKLP